MVTKWEGLGVGLLVDRGRAAAVGSSLVLLTLVAGCGGGHGDGKASASATTPTPTATTTTAAADPQASEKAAVLAAYTGMTTAEEHSYVTGKLDPNLQKYAGGKAFTDIETTLFDAQQSGTVDRGTVTRSPKVTTIDTTSVPLKATVVDCADSTHYSTVYAKTGKAIPYDGPRRHVVTSTAARSTTGTWKIYTYVIERDRTC